MVFQSLPFDKLRANGLKNTPSTGSGRNRTGGTIGLESGAWKLKEIKNSYKDVILIVNSFFAIRGERVEFSPHAEPAGASTASISVRTEPVEVWTGASGTYQNSL
jgi:hypothetical protein